MAASGASLGSAWVEVTADASNVASSLQSDVSRALQQLVSVFEKSFGEGQAAAEDAAAGIATAFDERAGEASASAEGIAAAAGDSAGQLSEDFTAAAGVMAAEVAGAAADAESALEAVDPGDPFSELGPEAEAAAAEAAAALSDGLTDTGLVESATVEGEKATDALAASVADGESKIGDAAKTLALGLGVGFAAVGAASLAAAMSVDDAYDTIRIGTGATGAELTGLQNSFTAVAKTVPADMGDVAGAVTGLNQRLGLTGPTLEKLAAQVLQAGNLGGAALNVNDLTAAFSVFGVKGEATTGVMDDLFRVSQATGVGINDLTGTLSKSGAQLTGLGFSITDAASLLGTLDKAGINSGAAAASLGRAMVSLAKAGEDPQEAFKRVTGEIGGFIDKGDQAGALDLASKVFGTKGATQFVTALQSGALNLDSLTASAGLSSDSILGLADETADFPEMWQEFQNTATLALAPLGAQLFPVLAAAIGDAGVVLSVVVDKLAGFGDWLNSTGIPALRSFAGWVSDNATAFGIVAGIIAAVFLPHLIALGVQYVITQVKAVASWIAQSAGAIAAAAVHSAQIAWMILRWIALGAAAVVQAAVVVAQYVWLGVQATASAAVVAAQWLASQIRTGISLAVMAAGFIAQGAVMVASVAVTVASVVAGWVLMGVQSLIQAARMAAAWLIAMGPIGWAIAAVIALVALIIANWDTVKQWTVEAWNAVTAAIGAAWEWIKGAVAAAFQFLLDLFLNWTPLGIIISHWEEIKAAFTAGVEAVVGFVTALPGRVIAGLAAFGQMLADAATAAWKMFSDTISAGVTFVVDLATGFVRRFLDGLAVWGQRLGDLATAAWKLLSDAVTTGVTAVITFVTGFPARTVQAISNIGALIAGIATSAWQWFYDNVVAKVGELISFVGGLPGKVVSAIGNLGSLLVQKGKDLIQGLVDGIGAAAGYVGDIAKKIVNSVIGFINDKFIDHLNYLLDFTIMGIHINPPDIPHIPRLAAGAVVDRPTLALIGEAGREAVIPLSAGRAGRRAAVMNEAGLGGSTYVTYAPEVLIPRQATAAEAVALMRKDLSRSLRLGLLDGDLGSLEGVSG